MAAEIAPQGEPTQGDPAERRPGDLILGRRNVKVWGPGSDFDLSAMGRTIITNLKKYGDGGESLPTLLRRVWRAQEFRRQNPSEG